jgi:hypothetical protein
MKIASLNNLYVNVRVLILEVFLGNNKHHHLDFSLVPCLSVANGKIFSGLKGLYTPLHAYTRE